MDLLVQRATEDKKGLKETAEYQVSKERGVVQVTLVSRVLLVSLVSKENLVQKVTRERWEVRAKKVWPAFPDATAQMDKRVKLEELVLLDAKETQATGVPMVTLEMSVSVVLWESVERREILVVPEGQVQLAHLESPDLRGREEVLDLLVLLDRKETLDFLE